MSEKALYGLGSIVIAAISLAVIYWSLSGIVADIRAML